MNIPQKVNGQYSIASIIQAKSDILTLLILGIISVPNTGLPIGPARIRPIDVITISIVLLSVVVNPQVRISRFAFRLVLPLIAVFLYAIIYLAFQPYPMMNTIVDLIELIEVITLLIALLNLFHYLSEEYLHGLMYSVAIWTTLSSAIGITVFLDSGTRLVYNPFVVGLPSFSLYYFATQYIQDMERKYVIFSMIIALRILFTQSRSVWVSMIVAGIALMVIDGTSTINRIRDQIATLFAGVGAACFVALLLFPGIVARILSLVRGTQFLFARPIIYISGLQLLLKYPFGVGLGNFTAAVSNLARTADLVYPIWFHELAGDWIINYSLQQLAAGNWGAHSDFVLLFVELGIIGGFLLILFWIIIFKLVIITKRSRVNKALRFTLLFFLFQSFFKSFLITSGNWAGVILMLTLSLSLYSKSRS